MYLSRLILNARDREVQREIANPYELHRTVMSGYPADLPESERVLFRLDADPNGVTALHLLVQSVGEPDWRDITQRPGYLLSPHLCPPRACPNPAVKSFDLALAPGQTLAFRLRANPTVKRQGKRHGLYREEDQRAWLDRKGSQGGFRIVRVTAAQEDETHAWIKLRDDGDRVGRRQGTFFAVRFEGLLQVTDPQRLVTTVADGIGPAKGFGFGLLSLAAVR